MVAQGATTIWERSNGDTGDLAMTSINHDEIELPAGVGGLVKVPGQSAFEVRAGHHRFVRATFGAAQGHDDGAGGWT